MHSLGQALWGNIWKHTVGKSQINVTNATMPLLWLAIWGDIWKRTVEKSQTNATNVTMHPLKSAIWGDISKHTVDKSQINASSVTMHPLMQAIWGVIWKRTVAKKPNRCSKCDVVHFDLFEETHEEAQTSLEMKKVTPFFYSSWADPRRTCMKLNQILRFTIL